MQPPEPQYSPSTLYAAIDFLLGHTDRQITSDPSLRAELSRLCERLGWDRPCGGCPGALQAHLERLRVWHHRNAA